MCTDTQYPSVVKEEPAFLCTVSVYSLVYPVYVRVRLNICKIRDQPPLTVCNVFYSERKHVRMSFKPATILFKQH